MAGSHKNKTFATFLALILGGLGAHRFYLYGWKDLWAWLHFATLLISLLLVYTITDLTLMFAAGPLIISVLVSFIETLVIGLTPDEQWDAKHNQGSGRKSQSGWPVVVLLVLTVGMGSTALFATLARTVDLLYTGGAYG
jgi:TM2 domain-containing membrane protein YozV